jgi:NodT family efflux transporter outer membrane factor (OMF) lipoprotein
MIKKSFLLCIYAGVLLQNGCSTIEPNLHLEVESAKEFSAKNSAISAMPKEKWWRDFHAAELNSLIEKGVDENPDVRIAYERITQAKILRNFAAAPQLPSVDLRAASSLSQRDGQNIHTSNSKATNAEISMSYELDVWGRIAANVRLADENIAISKYDYEALKLTLAANIAQNYFYYQSTLERVNIAKGNLDIAQKVLDVMDARLRFGAINALDVSRQKNVLYKQNANLIMLQNQLIIYKNALAILVGTTPANFSLEAQSLRTLSSPVVNAGLPSELLLRRPDIAASRAAIGASKAAIQLTDAARYPSFSLSGSAGTSSSELLSMSDPLNILSMGLGMGYNIFDDGRLTNARLTEESKANAVLQIYKRTILTAFKEVEDALNTIHYTTQNLELADKTLKESAYTFELASIQYKNGHIDFNTFLDVQQSYFTAQENLLLTKQEKLLSLVTLYKALGGGFELSHV